MLDIEHVATLRFKMSIAFIVYQLCDKAMLSRVSLDEFVKKNREYNFSSKLFHKLAEYGINENHYLNHTAKQPVIDELGEFYTALFGVDVINNTEA